MTRASLVVSVLLMAGPARANDVCVDAGGVPTLPPRAGLPSYSKGELRWEPLHGGPAVTYGWCDGIPLGGG